MFLFHIPERKGKSDVYDVLFYVGMWWRIIYGLLRILAGLYILNFLGQPIAKVFHHVMSMRLIEGRNDFMLRIFDPFLSHTNFFVTNFLSFYLIFWGALEIVLFLSLLKQKKWVFPLSMYLITIFVIYSIFRFTHTHSYILLGVIVVDLILLFLIKKEYDKLRFSTKDEGL